MTSSFEKGSGYVIIKVRTSVRSETARGMRWAREAALWSPWPPLYGRRPRLRRAGGAHTWFAFWGRSGCWWRLLLPHTVPATPQPWRRPHKDSTLLLSSQLGVSELLCSGGCAASGSSGRLVSLGPVKRLPSDCICWGPSSLRPSRSWGSAVTRAMREPREVMGAQGGQKGETAVSWF